MCDVRDALDARTACVAELDQACIRSNGIRLSALKGASEALRGFYGGVVAEPVPPRFSALLDALGGPESPCSSDGTDDAAVA